MNHPTRVIVRHRIQIDDGMFRRVEDLQAPSRTHHLCRRQAIPLGRSAVPAEFHSETVHCDEVSCI